MTDIPNPNAKPDPLPASALPMTEAIDSRRAADRQLRFWSQLIIGVGAFILLLATLSMAVGAAGLILGFAQSGGDPNAELDTGLLKVGMGMAMFAGFTFIPLFNSGLLLVCLGAILRAVGGGMIAQRYDKKTSAQSGSSTGA